MTLFVYADGREIEAPAASVCAARLDGKFPTWFELYDPKRPKDRVMFDREVRYLPHRIVTIFVERGTVRDMKFELKVRHLLEKKHRPPPPPPAPLAPLPFTPNIGPRTA